MLEYIVVEIKIFLIEYTFLSKKQFELVISNMKTFIDLQNKLKAHLHIELIFNLYKRSILWEFLSSKILKCFSF